MKKIIGLAFWATVLSLFLLTSCGGDGGGDTPQPQPTSVALTVTSATFNGSAINPTPDYTLTLNFDADGNPNGYSVSGTADKQPTVGSSGTFTVTGSTVTFTSGGVSRIVSFSGGSISSNTASVNLSWDLTKVDDGVSAAEQGTYVYAMTAQ